MAKSIRCADETKARIDAFQAEHDLKTVDDALVALLDAGERVDAEEVLDAAELASVRLVRKISRRACDEMVAALLHAHREHEESIADADREREALQNECDELTSRVAELDPLEAEVETLRAKLAEADAVRENTEKIVADLAAQKEEWMSKFAASADAQANMQASMMEEIRASREEASQLREQVSELLERLSAVDTEE